MGWACTIKGDTQLEDAMKSFAFGLSLLFASQCLLAADAPKDAAPAKENMGMRLLYHEDFKDAVKAMARLEFTDPGIWKIVPDNGRNVLTMTELKLPDPKLPRGPGGRAWIKDVTVSAFVMDVKLRSTVKDYPHRDMILLFAGRDPSHLMYVHLGKIADPHCNSIFLVDGKDRVSVATRTSKGTDWDDNFHVARLVRTDSGQSEVFWDGQSVMTSDDKTIPIGRLGFGSFDDKGDFVEITVWGKAVAK
jgi:hypothetical protein